MTTATSRPPRGPHPQCTLIKRQTQPPAPTHKHMYLRQQAEHHRLEQRGAGADAHVALQPRGRLAELEDGHPRVKDAVDASARQPAALDAVGKRLRQQVKICEWVGG